MGNFSKKGLQLHRKTVYEYTGPYYVYVLECCGRHKVGRTVNIDSRIEQIQAACPHKLKLVCLREFVNIQDMYECEKDSHAALAEYRCHNEWFDGPEDVIVGCVRGYQVKYPEPSVKRVIKKEYLDKEEVKRKNLKEIEDYMERNPEIFGTN